MAHQPMEVNIVVIGARSGDDSLSELKALPSNARIVAHGATVDEVFEAGDNALARANVRDVSWSLACSIFTYHSSSGVRSSSTV